MDEDDLTLAYEFADRRRAAALASAAAGAVPTSGGDAGFP